MNVDATWWDAISSIAQIGLLVAAAGSLIFAWRSGFLTRLIEHERRLPQVGVQLVSWSPTRDEAQGMQIPAEQREGYIYWLTKAVERDPQDWVSYSIQKHQLLVDNGGLGPALRVTVRYKLTVFDVDDSNPPVEREDPVATHDGVLEVFHVNPGTQKYASIHVDTSYYPSYRLEWEPPEIIAIDGEQRDNQWTDLGDERRVTMGNNKATWDAWRTSIWDAARAAEVVVVPGDVRWEGGAIVLPLTVTARNSAGNPVASSASVHVTNATGTVALGPYALSSGLHQELRLPAIAVGPYRVIAIVGTLSASAMIQVPEQTAGFSGFTGLAR